MTFLYLLFCFFSWAADPLPSIDIDSTESKLLSQARSLNELEKSKYLVDRLRYTQVACKMALKNQNVPTQCYSFIYYLNQVGMEKKKSENVLGWLDTLCLRRAKNIVSLDHLPKNYNFLTSKCEAALTEQENKLIYIYGEKDQGETHSARTNSAVSSSYR